MITRKNKLKKIKKVANFGQLVGRFLSFGFIFLTTFAFSANPYSYLNQTQIQNINNQFVFNSKVKAKAIEIESGVLKLISQKDLDYLQKTSDSSGLITRSITDKGYQKETVQKAIIYAESLKLNGQSIFDSLEPVNLENRFIKELSSQSKLTDQLKQAGIDLQSLTANNKQWNESITTLSVSGQLIVKALVSYFTAGSAVGLVEASNAMAQVAIDAAMQSLIDQVAIGFVGGAITGDVSFDIETIIKGAVVAGATAYAGDYIGSKEGLNLAGSQKDIANTVAEAGIDTAVNGGSFADNLKNSAISTVGKNAAGVIGANKESLGQLGQKLAHAGVGCGLAIAGGGDCGSGAFGAVVGEMLAEGIGESDLDDDTVLMLSQIGVITLASANDLDVVNAEKTGTNAVKYNYLSTRQKEKFAKELKECKGLTQCGLKVAEKYGVSLSQDAALGTGVVAGLGEGVYNEAEQLVEALSNPKEAVEGLKALLNDPSIIGDVAQAEFDEVKSLLTDFETNYELAGVDGAFDAGRNLGNIAGKAIALIGGTATGAGGVAFGTSKAVGKVVGKLKAIQIAKDINIKSGSKIAKQMPKRGWSKKDIVNTIANPSKKVKWKDARWNEKTGKKNNDPATAFYDKNGNYVVKNDITGDIVQVSDKTKTDWKIPWD